MISIGKDTIEKKPKTPAESLSQKKKKAQAKIRVDRAANSPRNKLLRKAQAGK